MRITTELVKTFNLCSDSFNNYQTEYPNSDLHITEFLKLDKIHYIDKIFVWKNVATINESALFGLKCSDSVLHIFETKYPDDKGPRLTLKYVKTYLDNPTEENKKAFKTTARAVAAASVVFTAVVAAANATATAAYISTTDAMVGYAMAVYNKDVDAATAYAAAAYAEYAAYAAVAAAASSRVQQDKNIQFLIEIYEGK